MLANILNARVSVGLICSVLLFDLVGTGLEMVGMPIFFGLAVRTAFIAFIVKRFQSALPRANVWVMSLCWFVIEMACWMLLAHLSEIPLSELLFSTRM